VLLYLTLSSRCATASGEEGEREQSSAVRKHGQTKRVTSITEHEQAHTESALEGLLEQICGILCNDFIELRALLSK